MARVETIVPQEAKPGIETAMRNPFVSLRASQIKLDPATDGARPGPERADEPDLLGALADSIKSIGQIVPLTVESREDGYYLIDGRRRRAAALRHLPPDFLLQCFVRNAVSVSIWPQDAQEARDAEALQAAVHANVHRRNYNALQFAHVCQAVRSMHGWTGTKQVAKYLGVSRAQVWKHDQLLKKPDGMPEAEFDQMIGLIQSNELGAEAAFWALTHIEPERVVEVVEEARKEAYGAVEGMSTPTPASKTAPANPQTARTTPRITGRQVRRAAKTTAALKTGAAAPQPRGRAASADHKPTQRTLPELRRLFEALQSAAYPDVMRNFVTTLADSWWRGDATNQEVIQAWTNIAVILEKRRGKQGKSADSKK